MTINVTHPAVFYDQDGKELITLTKILGGLYAEMHREDEMSARKTNRFQTPTFLKLKDPPRTIKEDSLSATIVFTPKTTQVVLKAANVAQIYPEEPHQRNRTSHRHEKSSAMKRR